MLKRRSESEVKTEKYKTIYHSALYSSHSHINHPEPMLSASIVFYIVRKVNFLLRLSLGFGTSTRRVNLLLLVVVQ